MYCSMRRRDGCEEGGVYPLPVVESGKASARVHLIGKLCPREDAGVVRGMNVYRCMRAGEDDIVY